MRHALIFVALLAVVTLGVAWSWDADAQGSKKSKWKEIEVGQIPSEFGDVAAFTGTTNNYAILFKDDDGVLRIVEFRGGKVNPKTFTMKRSYEK